MSIRKLKPALQYSQGRSRPWSGAELVNAFAEMADGDKADTYAVMALPGLVTFSSISGQAVRGVHNMADVFYAVVGATLYSIDAAGTATSLGTIPGSTPVMMADNGTELAIQAGSTGYVYSGGTLHGSIPNLPSVANVVYMDGYMVWTVYNSDQFIISALNDALTYDPLDVATVEGDPDNIVGVVNNHRELQFFGERTIEIWYNAGTADFPFARQGNAFIERGIIDRDSLVKIDNSVHFVGEDRIVYRLNGYDPVRISTHSIEYQLRDASWWRAFTHTSAGHKWYVLNTDVGCYAYDMATGAWAKRKSLDKVNYRGGCSVPIYGKTMIGDNTTGKIYYTDIDTNTEDGDAIPFEVQLPSLQTNRLRSTIYSFEAQIQAGVGTVSIPDPQVYLAYSRDGGNTYSPDLARTMGAEGAYLTRCIWRLGVSYWQLQIVLKMPSSVQRLVIAYWADIR